MSSGPMAELAGWSVNGLAALRLLLSRRRRSGRGDARQRYVQRRSHVRGRKSAPLAEEITQQIAGLECAQAAFNGDSVVVQW